MICNSGESVFYFHYIIAYRTVVTFRILKIFGIQGIQEGVQGKVLVIGGKIGYGNNIEYSFSSEVFGNNKII